MPGSAVGRTPRQRRGVDDPSPLVVLWRLAYALKGLSKEAALDVKLSEAARVVMSSELKVSGPLLLGLSRLHMMKVEVVESMAQGLIGKMLRNPASATWAAGGGARGKSSKKRGRGGGPPAESLPAISEEADGWSEAETIDALRENAHLLSPALKAIMEHMTPSSRGVSPFSHANTPLDDFIAVAMGSARSGTMESPIRSVNLAVDDHDDSAMRIDRLRELSQGRPSSAFSMGGGHSEGPRSGQKRGRRSSLSDRGVFDTMLDDGVQDSFISSAAVTPIGNGGDDGWEFRGLLSTAAPPTTRHVVARVASRRRRRVIIGNTRADRNKGADIGGISLLPTRQKRSHRKRNGGMPDLTPDDVVGFIATRLRSIDEMHEEDEDQESVIMPIASQELGHTFSPIGVRSVSEVSFMPPFTPDRRGSCVEEMQDEQDLPPGIQEIGTPFSDIGMCDTLDMVWSPEGAPTPSQRSASPASAWTASSRGFSRPSALRNALGVFWAKENEPTPTFQGLVRENPVKAFMEVLVMSCRGGCKPSQTSHWSPIFLEPSKC